MLRAALVPCSFGVASPALLLLSLVGEEEGVLGRHLGMPVSGWLETPDPIILWTPHQRTLPGLGSSRLRVPNTSLKLSGSVEDQSKQIDYFIMVTYPGQRSRGAYFNLNHNFIN